MKDTSYYPDINRCAPTEVRDDDVYQGLLCGKVHDEKAFALGESGHAGLFSTVPDLLKFMNASLNHEFPLKDETLDLLFKVQQIKPDLNGRILKRALGWDKPTEGSSAGDNRCFDDTILHTGFTGCNMFIDRLQGVGFVMLSNAVHPKRTQNKIIGYRRKIGNMILKTWEE